MSWGRKNGGVISVYFSVLLGITSLVIATTWHRATILRDIAQTTLLRQQRHLIYLEMIYYIRNEIYDGYYGSLTYEAVDWRIQVRFDKNEQVATLSLSHLDWHVTHQFTYDVECRCITDTSDDGTQEHVEENVEEA